LRCICIDRALAALALALLLALAAALAIGWSGGARAASLEGVLSPGPLIAGHAKNESDCESCHVPFDKRAQDDKCLACHREIGRDLRARTGYHGRQPPQACRSCHTDHRGRDARVIVLDPAHFDHGRTDFALRGGHAGVACARCHVASEGWRRAPPDCNGCHRSDDVHKGGLGTACADCHSESRWKEVRFDHDATHFPLRDRHAAVACADCHRDRTFRGTPTTCIGCHRADDRHQGHFGADCQACHDATGWRAIHFDHDRETRYPLRGRHRQAACTACHVGDLHRDRPGTECVACHRKDDRHRGTEGEACGNCHTERDWKEARFDHARTGFPLRGAHERVECNACHRSAVFTEAPRDCIGCHRKDDHHRGQFGVGCQDCHVEQDWKTIRFDHARDAKYPLNGRHAAVKCVDCHAGNPYADHLATACIACHRKDDRHRGQEGERCETCHIEQDWRTTRAKFDHDLARFPLLGRHRQVTCDRCHLTPQFKDAGTRCVACHQRDDRHQRHLGPDCEDCHDARDWKGATFDHDARTRFKLDGAHRSIACAACHRLPVDGKPILPSDCAACHDRDDVHGGSYGKQCARCHVTTRFRDLRDRLAP